MEAPRPRPPEAPEEEEDGEESFSIRRLGRTKGFRRFGIYCIERVSAKRKPLNADEIMCGVVDTWKQKTGKMSRFPRLRFS